MRKALLSAPAVERLLPFRGNKIPNVRMQVQATVGTANGKTASPSRSGLSMLASKHLNQGTSFPAATRTSFGLKGLVPPAQETLDQQVERVISRLNSIQSPIEKYTYLTRLKSENVVLFYRCLIDHLTQITPIIYTPIVGEACQKFSLIYTPGLVEGLFLSKDDVDVIPDVLGNWPYPQPDICVITDGSRILGLGDLGVNGMGIPIGKLSLYIAAAGFNPSRTLPITLDLGTNNEKYLKDPLYLGSRSKRPEDPEFFAYLDAVMSAIKAKWPKMLVQFEDFSSEHAFAALERYRHDYLCFNDDIQGTGAVVLAGFINAVRLSGTPLHKHKIVFFGAGSAGVGVASQLMEHLIKAGIDPQTARDMFWLVDSKGLVTFDRGDKLASHKTAFARSDNNGKQFKTLEDVIDYVQPTSLIGLAGQGGAFKPETLKKMADLNKLPIIFPLSNPLTNAECTFEQAMEHTNGRVLFASGTAFPACQDPLTKIVVEPGQGNNMYIFPGLGFGSVLAATERISDDMVHQTAVTLAESLTPEEMADRRLYPRLERIREISALIARDVVLVALREGLARDPDVLNIFDATAGQSVSKDVLENKDKIAALHDLVTSRMWSPEYSSAPVKAMM
ncbi:malic enzyme [Powellomyces hirtus]|nr:malic enzyme [Powellomyces hirtus]